MADGKLNKLRLHLMAERAMGQSGVPARRKPKVRGKAVDDVGGARGAVAPAGREAPKLVPLAGGRGAEGVGRSIGETNKMLSRPAAATVQKPATPLAIPTAASPVLFGDGLREVPFEAPPIGAEEKRVRLRQMDEGEVRGCRFCRLCEGRTNTVFGEGDVDAAVMFIGEGPGENEDLQGRPFVGAAGEMLNRQIAAMGLKREQVYICNIVKCRPPDNRVPMPDEVASCSPFLVRQIEIVRPRAIVTLGLPATKFILGNESIKMGSARGNWFSWRGIPVMPTYHPAYLKRVYTDETRRMVWSDLQKVMERVGLKGKA